MNRPVRPTRLTMIGSAVLAILLSGCVASPQTSTSDDELNLPAQVAAPFDGTASEWSEAMVACLQQEGWEASIPDGTPAGGFDSGPVEVSQEEQYQEDFERCQGSTGQLVEIQSVADLQRRYDLLVEQHACLVSEGYEVSAPPTFQTFLDAFNANGDTSAYYPLAELQSDESVRAETACPLEIFE